MRKTEKDMDGGSEEGKERNEQDNNLGASKTSFLLTGYKQHFIQRVYKPTLLNINYTEL